MIKIHIREYPWKAEMGVHLFKEDAGKHYAAAPCNLIFKPVEDGQLMPDAWLDVSMRHMREIFQGLCNELARLGYAPDTSRLAGEVDSVKAHLARETVQCDRIFALLDRTVGQSLLPLMERRG